MAEADRRDLGPVEFKRRQVRQFGNGRAVGVGKRRCGVDHQPLQFREAGDAFAGDPQIGAPQLQLL